jgi:hypothetical protein
MADAFEVSLDYLVGNSDKKLDKATINRIIEIDKLEAKDKEMVFTFLDAFLQNTKLQKIMG